MKYLDMLTATPTRDIIIPKLKDKSKQSYCTIMRKQAGTETMRLHRGYQCSTKWPKIKRFGKLRKAPDAKTKQHTNRRRHAK